MKKIYIAGPDVFEKEAKQIGLKYSQLCSNYGYVGLYPLDNSIDFNQTKKKTALDIFQANQMLIDESDVVIANLNSFRGKEADSGTVWECGYAFAKNKKVYAYMNSTKSYLNQFSLDEKKDVDGITLDLEDKMIEDFDYPLNLMLACSIIEIVEGSFEDALKRVKV